MILIEPIVIVERHVAFLSAFILAVKSAYPDEVLEFWSNSGKNKAIKSMLSLNGDISDICFYDMYRSKRPSNVSWLHRQLSLILVCIKCLYGKNGKHSSVIFCSTHLPVVLFIRWAKLLPWFCRKSVVMVHNNLILLDNNKITSPLIKLEDLNNHVVVLSKDIAEYVSEKLNNTINFKSIDIPCIWKETVINPEFKTPMKFGFMGESQKGLSLFYDIAKEVKAIRPEVDFWVIGRATAEELKLYGDLLNGMSTDWLSQEDYEQRIQDMSFLVLSYSDRYNYRASATFVDALSFIIPIIYSSSRYIDESIKGLGEIGVVCNGNKDMIRALVDIIDNMTAEKYILYKQNIIKYRDRFSVENVSKQIESVLKNV